VRNVRNARQQFLEFGHRPTSPARRARNLGLQGADLFLLPAVSTPSLRPFPNLRTLLVVTRALSCSGLRDGGAALPIEFPKFVEVRRIAPRRQARCHLFEILTEMVGDRA